MENRIARGSWHRPGTALIALAAITAITAAWWALALWPAGAVEPEWLARTRAACFGSQRGGLPDTRGWILLIGEPLGMLTALFAIWGASVKRDVVSSIATRAGRIAAAVALSLVLVGLAATTIRVVRATGVLGAQPESAFGTAVRVDVQPPATLFTDQLGHRARLADFRGRPTLLTFAFGHCTTVCPAVVSNLLAERRKAARPEIRLVVITLDPWRDTPDRLATIAARWGLAATDRILSGSIDEVQSALRVLGVGGRRSENTGDIDHAATVFLLDERGHVVWRVEGGWRVVSQILADAR